MRELQGLGDVLREREGELGACAERLEKAVSHAKSERARQADLFWLFLTLCLWMCVCLILSQRFELLETREVSSITV